MVVAVTGGTGFVGKRLVLRHVKAGDAVRVLTRRHHGNTGLPGEVSLFRGDLTGPSSDLIPFLDGADVLYHCAAEQNDPGRMYEVHVNGVRRLIEASHRRIGRWVHLSSVGVYGRPKRGTIAEDAPLKPLGQYEITKEESERLLVEASSTHQLPCVILRPCKVFGPEMPPQDLYQFINVIAKGLFFFIGKTGAIANYIHVDNVVEALVLCGTLPQAVGRTYNVSDWRTLDEFLAIIAGELGKPKPTLRLPEWIARAFALVLAPVPGFPLTNSRITGLVNRTVYDSARIERELGYTYVVSIEEGLRQMVSRWRDKIAAHA